MAGEIVLYGMFCGLWMLESYRLLGMRCMLHERISVLYERSSLYQFKGVYIESLKIIGLGSE